MRLFMFYEIGWMEKVYLKVLGFMKWLMFLIINNYYVYKYKNIEVLVFFVNYLFLYIVYLRKN